MKHAHIRIFSAPDWKRETLVFTKIVFCRKWSKTGFVHFPENTIERLGFDRFFGRDRATRSILSMYLATFWAKRRPKGGTWDPKSWPRRVRGAFLECSWPHGAICLVSMFWGVLRGPNLAPCIWTNNNLQKQHRCSREGRIYWGFSKWTFVCAPGAI